MLPIPNPKNPVSDFWENHTFTTEALWKHFGSKLSENGRGWPTTLSGTFLWDSLCDSVKVSYGGQERAWSKFPPPHVVAVPLKWHSNSMGVGRPHTGLPGRAILWNHRQNYNFNPLMYIYIYNVERCPPLLSALTCMPELSDSILGTLARAKWLNFGSSKINRGTCLWGSYFATGFAW